MVERLFLCSKYRNSGEEWVGLSWNSHYGGGMDIYWNNIIGCGFCTVVLNWV